MVGESLFRLEQYYNLIRKLYKAYNVYKVYGKYNQGK